MSATLRNRANWTFGLPKTLHAFGVNIFLLPLGIATSILIARSVGPAGKGTLDLIVATSALLGMVLAVSLPQGVTFVVAQGKVAANVLASQLVVVSLLQALVALIILSLLRFTPYFQMFLPAWGVWIVAGVVMYVWVDLVTKFWSGILAGQQQIAVVNNAEFVGRVAQFVSIFILSAALYWSGSRLSVGVLFLVTLSASALINLLQFASLGFKFQLSRDLSGLKGALNFAVPCYAANLAQFLNYKLDVFVVGFFAGTASVGRYTLAVSLGQLLWLMSNSVATVLLPKIAASTDDGVSIRHTARVTRLSVWATAICGLALGVLATQAIPLAYGEAFRPSVMALLWLLPGIVLFSIANVLAAYIAGIGKPRLNLLVSGVSLIVTISLDLLLIPRLNIVGAAIASTVSYSLSALLLIVFFMRETGAPLREILLPTSEDVRMLLSVARLRVSSESTV
ncbi:MAG TPA: polysaccharide biosynthesis C-terminal domain-containing protein [Pyrinomonadaceae bacterium]|nr:polysaccharide biosynthesis C-terminal domain-containing protein [Pyrinomonadaceae bacterium]